MEVGGPGGGATPDAASLIDALERGGVLLVRMVEALPEGVTTRRPAAGGWCIREVLGHLLSEESEDFRARLGCILREPMEEFPPLDPEARVREGAFIGRTAADLLAAFSEERRRSLEWLRAFDGPDLHREKTHPRFPSMRAGDMLSAWVAHDLLHLRQIVRILHATAVEDAQPFSTDYAGEW